jgi:hypothetical protein
MSEVFQEAEFRDSTIKEYRKGQIIRIIDVVAIAPVLIYAGVKKSGLPDWVRYSLVVFGAATAYYNAKNFYINYKNDHEKIKDLVRLKKENSELRKKNEELSKKNTNSNASSPAKEATTTK